MTGTNAFEILLIEDVHRDVELAIRRLRKGS